MIQAITFIIGILMGCAGTFMEAFHVGDGSYVVTAGVGIVILAIFIG